MKSSVQRKMKRNWGGVWKETLLGSRIEMDLWKVVLYAGGGTLLRDCILWVTHAGAGTPLKGLWPRGNPCQSRVAVRSKEQ